MKVWCIIWLRLLIRQEIPGHILDGVTAQYWLFPTVKVFPFSLWMGMVYKQTEKQHSIEGIGCVFIFFLPLLPPADMTTMALCVSTAYHKSSKGRQDKKGVLQRRGPGQQTCTVSGIWGGGIRLTHAIMNCVHHREPAALCLSCLDTASASSI